MKKKNCLLLLLLLLFLALALSFKLLFVLSSIGTKIWISETEFETLQVVLETISRDRKRRAKIVQTQFTNRIQISRRDEGGENRMPLKVGSSQI